jgi:DNA-binding MarR family transcriptional regulator
MQLIIIRVQKMAEEFKIDLEKNLMPWIGHTSKLIDYYIIECMAREGVELTKVQLVLLKRLKEDNGIPQHDLAFLTNRDKASLARLLNTMEKKNLLARIPSDKDHRINLIYITKHGETILKSAWPIMKGIFKKMHTGVREDDILRLIDVLRRIQKNLHGEDLFDIREKILNKEPELNHK